MGDANGCLPFSRPDTHSQAYSDTDSHSYSHPGPYADSDACTHTYTHAKSYSYSNSCPNAHTYTGTNSYPDSNPDSDSYANRTTNALDTVAERQRFTIQFRSILIKPAFDDHGGYQHDRRCGRIFASV